MQPRGAPPLGHRSGDLGGKASRAHDPCVLPDLAGNQELVLPDAHRNPDPDPGAIQRPPVAVGSRARRERREAISLGKLHRCVAGPRQPAAHPRTPSTTSLDRVDATQDSTPALTPRARPCPERSVQLAYPPRLRPSASGQPPRDAPPPPATAEHNPSHPTSDVAASLMRQICVPAVGA